LGVLTKNQGYGKMMYWGGGIVEIEFVQGSQKLNNGSGKTIHLGTVD
jgi:hypothetical protein